MSEQTTTLNERIARALGWQLTRFPDGGYGLLDPNGRKLLAWTERPDRGYVYGKYVAADTEKLIWELVAPDWEHDADAALALPHDGWQLRLFSPDDDEPDDWEALYTQPDVVGYRAFGATPAAAIGEAWLAWRARTET